MDFDYIINRRETESIKWNKYGEDVLPMWVADMDFRSPEPVITALHQRVDHGIFGYGCPPESLLEVIAAHLADRHGWVVDTSDIAFICGVVTGFTHAIYCFTQPGDRILIQTPAYPPFLVAPASTGRELVTNELIQDGNGKYEINFDDFETKLASGVKLFILCNPQNPTGRVFSQAELSKMAELCLKHGVIICSDEIHWDLVFRGHKHIPIASLSPEIAEKTVTYLAPSKTFNIAGLATSVYVAKCPEMQKTLSTSMQMLLGHPNILGIHAALAAYQEGRPWLDAVVQYLEGNRDQMVNSVTQHMPGVKVSSPEATYLGWLDCRQLNLNVSPQQFFLNKAKVGLNDGSEFGSTGEGFVRLNFGCPRAVLEEGLDRMIAALEKRQ